MSTNFYAVKVPTVQEHETMQKLLAEKQYKQLQEMLEQSQTRYHIGKRSSGWQFLFCASDSVLAPWAPTKEAITEFLSREDIKIENEYGESFTVDEFWKEIEDYIYHDDRHINGVDAHCSYRSDTEYTTHEGLRFSTRADFS